MGRVRAAVRCALCAVHGADQDARGFSAKSQLVALLYAQLAGAASLRAVEAEMASHADQFQAVGVVPARRATLADANAQRPAAVFTDLFATMVRQAGRGLRRALGGDLAGTALYLVDATDTAELLSEVLPLDGRSRAWAHFSAHACGAKPRVILNASNTTQRSLTNNRFAHRATLRDPVSIQRNSFITIP